MVFQAATKKKKRKKFTKNNGSVSVGNFRSAIFANCICRLTCAKTKSGRFSHVFVFLFSWFLKRYSFKKYASQKLFEVYSVVFSSYLCLQSMFSLFVFINGVWTLLRLNSSTLSRTPSLESQQVLVSQTKMSASLC